MAQLNRSQLKALSRKLQRVPVAAADLVAKDAWVYQIVVANTAATATTFTVADKQGTARKLFPTVSLAANSLTIATFPEGVLMSGGINWASSADALDAAVDAYCLP